MTTTDLKVTAEMTPNPNTIKFGVSKVLLTEGTIDFKNREEAETSPLARELFDIEGIQAVFVGSNFVSVSKIPSYDWPDLIEPITDTIKFALDEYSEWVDVSKVKVVEGTTDDLAVAERVKAILDNEIRPAIAMDGGDIQFHGYANGVVTLHLQGACSTCPSSTLTLKIGIESRLKEEIPEIKEVIQVQ